MTSQATANDADMILKLYDLRREAEMRKARNWWLVTFWPERAEDVYKVGMAMGTAENNWLRQVAGYWEMAASLVNHGTLNEALFLEPAFSGEMFFIFAKVRPFLQELREKFESPTMWQNIEQVIQRSEKGRTTLKQFEERVAARRKAMAQEKGKKEAVA
ncbi:MAG: hypothetical protein JO249_20995 [Acidobacteria bacterium]|nr:hypothetical protein [Acidobacteriota bacterium]